MKPPPFTGKETAGLAYNAGKNYLTVAFQQDEFKTTNKGLIRFEEKKEYYVWAHPNEIIFAISADHYVKALIQCGIQNKWMTRHCTIKELLTILPNDSFIRLNKFYLLNCNHFSCIDEKKKMIYLLNDSSVPVTHRISRFMLDMVKK